MIHIHLSNDTVLHNSAVDTALSIMLVYVIPNGSRGCLLSAALGGSVLLEQGKHCCCCCCWWWWCVVANTVNSKQTSTAQGCELRARVFLLLPLIKLILWAFVYDLLGCISKCLHLSDCLFTHAFSPISWEHYWKSVHTLPPSPPSCWKLWGLFSPVNVTHQSYQRWSRSLKPTQVPPQGGVCPDPYTTLRCFSLEPFHFLLTLIVLVT